MGTIRHVFSLKANATDVRAALNTPQGITGWWAKNAEIGSGVGTHHTLRFDKNGTTVVMKFRIDVDSAKKVVWTCTENGNPLWPETTLTWSLSPDGDTTRVVFEHSGFAESDSPPYKMTVDGWEHFIESLQSYTETGHGKPW